MTFKLNMTDEEAEAKEYQVPPTGRYLCRITDLSIEEVKKQGDNFGKPYWKLTMVVEEGKYKGDTIFTTVMLFDKALFALRDLCFAVHPEYIEGNAINIPSVENGMPDPSPWLGQLVNIKGTKYPEGSVRQKTGEFREYDEFKVKFLKKDGTGSKSESGIGGLPLP